MKLVLKQKNGDERLFFLSFSHIESMERYKDGSTNRGTIAMIYPDDSRITGKKDARKFDRSILQGLSECSAKEQYDKAIGRHIALERALVPFLGLDEVEALFNAYYDQAKRLSVKQIRKITDYCDRPDILEVIEKIQDVLKEDAKKKATYAKKALENGASKKSQKVLEVKEDKKSKKVSSKKNKKK